MKKILFIFAAFLLNNLLYSQERIDFPEIKYGEQLVHHKHYSFSYIEGYELVNWLAYELISSEAEGNLEYKAKYKEDPDISTGSASMKDYKKSGFVIGQLAPVEDFRFSEEAIDEALYLSNAVPQKPAFNKYTWTTINNLIKAWAKESGKLIIITGPVLKDAPFGTFGKNKVSIPTRFYKVVFDPEKKIGFGFLVKASTASGSVKSYCYSIDKIEEETGIDFFPSLSKEQETAIESKFNKEDWDFEILD